MTVPQFRRWLQSKIDWFRAIPEECREIDHYESVYQVIAEAYDHAIELCLPEVAAECHRGAPMARLLAILNAIPDSLSVANAARQLGVSQGMVYKLCREGTLPHTRIGRRITITPAQLAQYSPKSKVQYRHL